MPSRRISLAWGVGTDRRRAGLFTAQPGFISFGASLNNPAAWHCCASFQSCPASLSSSAPTPFAPLAEQQYAIGVELAVDDSIYAEPTMTKAEILAKVAAGEISVEEASKLLEKAEQAKK